MLVFSIFLGILLRFLMLTANISLCHAEWQGVEISLLPLNEVILWFARDVHPPLYFSILHGILKTLGPQDLWLRLPSFITGCGTLIAIYWIAENFFGKQTARLSLFLAAISPFLIHLSHEVRNHGPATFFVVLATFFLIRLTQSPLNKIRASLFIGAALLAVYTAHLTWFWFAGILSFHIVYLIQTSQAKKSLWAHAIFLVLASPALVLFIYQITQNHELTGGWVGLENYSGLTLIKTILVVYWNLFFGPLFPIQTTDLFLFFLKSSHLFQATLVLFLVTIFLWMKSLFSLLKINKATFTFFFMTSLFPILFIGLTSPTRLEAKYFGFAGVFALILIAHQITALKNHFKFLFSTALILLYSYGAIYLIGLGTDAYQRENYSLMARFIASNAGPKDLVQDNALSDYYKKSLSLPKNYHSFTEYAELTAQSTQHFKRIWIVDSPRPDTELFSNLKQQMKLLGFQLRSDPRSFAGVGSNLFVSIFESDSTTTSPAV